MSSLSFFIFFIPPSKARLRVTQFATRECDNTRRKRVSILSSRKAKSSIEANLHSVCRTSATGSWRGLVHPRGYFRSAYGVRASKVDSRCQRVFESSFLVQAERSGCKEWRGRWILHGMDRRMPGRHCLWRISPYLPPVLLKLSIDSFIAIDIRENINRSTTNRGIERFPRLSLHRTVFESKTKWTRSERWIWNEEYPSMKWILLVNRKE